MTPIRFYTPPVRFVGRENRIGVIFCTQGEREAIYRDP